MQSSPDTEKLGVRRSGLRTLLADPYTGSREGLRASLEAEGCVVATAPDTFHAVALMRAGGFDFGVIDLGLSPAQGLARSAWDLARLFRDLNPTAPIVLLAAELSRDFEAETACVCPALLLEKPINPTHLRNLVRVLRAEPTQS